MDGVIADDSYIPQARDSHERLILQEMEDRGYTPVLDLGTDWSTVYFPSEDVYEFCLSVYGVYVGKRKACLMYGIAQGKQIMKDTHPIKQQQSSEPAE